MKILHFLSHFSILSETFVYDEINLLEKAWPHSNTVVTFERLLEKERPYARVDVLNKTPTLAQNLHRHYLKRIRRIRIPREDFPLYSYLARRLDSFDLVHVHFAWNALRLCQTLKLAGWQRRKPIVVQCQGTDVQSAPLLDPEYKRQLLEIAGYENVFFTANSEFMKQRMVELGISAAKIHLVPNAFNSAFPNHRKQKIFKTGDCLKVINTARFIEWKGQKYLIKGFAEFVRRVYPNSMLTLVGDGDTLPQMKALAESEDVSKHVTFLGSVAHREVPPLLSEHDLYVQPSIVDPKTFQQEGLPLAVLEAMSVGLPLIVTRTGGMPEIVGEDNTFARIIPDQNSNAIHTALKEMFADGSCFQKMLAYSQKRLAAFSQDRQLENLKALYQEALKRR